MGTLISVLWFLLIFCVVVVSHEFGHFIIAKANGIHVVEFYVGFGPAIIKWEKGGTKYSVRLLPLGGACVFEGMDAVEEAKKEELEGEQEEPEENDVIEADFANAERSVKTGSFPDASVWSRFATVVAGPIFNFILGFIIAFIMVNMIAVRDPVVTEVIEGGAAQAAGIEDGDKIIAMNDTKICLYDDIVLFNALHEGGDILITYMRDGKTYQTLLTPQYSEEYGRYMLGISNSTFVKFKGFDGVKYAAYEMRYNFMMTTGSLVKLFTGHVKSTDVAGPVGIAVNVVGQTYENTKEYGWQTVLVNMMNIALMLTVNLGILNLLPIPALDGGRLLFIIIEMLRGKPVPREKEAFVHFLGIIFFLILMVFVFFNDIKNIFF